MKIWLSREWINWITKFRMPFCRKFQALTRKIQNLFIIFSVRSYSCPKWPRCHRVYTRHWHLMGYCTFLLFASFGVPNKFVSNKCFITSRICNNESLGRTFESLVISIIFSQNIFSSSEHQLVLMSNHYSHFWFI